MNGTSFLLKFLTFLQQLDPLKAIDHQCAGGKLIKSGLPKLVLVLCEPGGKKQREELGGHGSGLHRTASGARLRGQRVGVCGRSGPEGPVSG